MKDDENHRANHRDEVQRQVHDISYDGLGTKLLKGALENFAELLNGVAAGLDLTSLANHGTFVASKKCAIKCVEKRILQQVVAGDQSDECGALVENQKHRCEDGERPIDEDQDGELGQVGEGEHANNRGHVEGNVLREAHDEGLPQRAMRDEVEDSLWLSFVKLRLSLAVLGDIRRALTLMG